MTIEQKAKAYDEAYKRATIRFGTNVADEIFPELVESEDKKLCIEIANFLRLLPHSEVGEKQDKWIAWLEKQESVGEIVSRCKNSWYNEGKIAGMAEGLTDDEKYQQGRHDALEKQGEQKDFRKRYKKIAESEWFKKTYENMSLGIPCSDCVNVKGCINCVDGDMKETKAEQKPTVVPKFRIGDTITPKGKKEYYTITDIVDGWYEFKEKHVNGGIPINYQFGWELVEQKPNDKIEPKFKVGDWITNGACIIQITSVDGAFYWHDNNCVGGDIESMDKEYHLWSIEDAKPGDVLASKDNSSILIFRNLDTSTSFSSYYNIAGKGELGWSNKCFIPATKEQREKLEKAMADAGYTFDFEKKELRKMKDKEYDGDDYGIDSLWHAQRILEKTLGKVEGYQTDDGILDHRCAITVVKKLAEQKELLQKGLSAKSSDRT